MGDVIDWLADAFVWFQDALDYATGFGLIVLPIIGIIVFAVITVVNWFRGLTE